MPSYVERRSYLQMAREKPGDIRREEECYKLLFEGFPVLGSVLEVFGGAGILRGVLDRQGIIGPETVHEAWDFSEDCVAHLRQRWPGSNVRHVDSFATEVPKHLDLVSADFNSWTVHKFFTRPEYWTLTSRIFTANAWYVQLTDAAVSKVHLNRLTYAKHFGVPTETVDDYLVNLGRLVFETFGYNLAKVTYHSNASYLLFQREPLKVPFNVQKVK